MIKVRNIFSFSLILMLTACGDQFTTIRDIDFPEHESRLAVFSSISGNKGEISVSYSKAIDDNKPYQRIEADIRLLEDGKEFYKFRYLGNEYTGKEYFLLPSELKTGHEYTLIAESDKYGKATSVQVLPALPVVSNIKFTKDGIIDPEGDKADQLSFDIDDKAGEENFYMAELEFLEIFQGDTVSYTMPIESYDPGVRDFWFIDRQGVIISDKNFDGTVSRIILSLNVWNENPEIRVRVYSITKDHYHFLLSYSQYQNSNDNPFAEPVNVHNNIQNGYGLFQVSNYVEFFITQ